MGSKTFFNSWNTAYLNSLFNISGKQIFVFSYWRMEALYNTKDSR
jgi:hypothetical protein